jgi:hypothetical protein
VLIPVGISILFFDDGGTVLPKGKGNEGNSKKGESIIYAETGDLTELMKINIPAPSIDKILSSIQLEKPSFGFANEEKQIAINVESISEQISYLSNKIKQLDSKYSELKTKNIKDKEKTLNLLLVVKNQCIAKRNKIESKENTYEFNEKTLKLYTKRKIDLKSLKVYSIENEESNNGYYLSIKDQYFYLNKSGGKLSIVLNNEIIEILSLY